MILNVFDRFDAEWRRTYDDCWEVKRHGDVFRVSCPHGWSAQSGDLQPGEALAAHQGICDECRHDR